MSLLSEHDDSAGFERTRASWAVHEAEFPEPFVEKDTPRQAGLFIVGSALACWLVIGLIALSVFH